jgi:hypothetical protein
MDTVFSHKEAPHFAPNGGATQGRQKDFTAEGAEHAEI